MHQRRARLKLDTDRRHGALDRLMQEYGFLDSRTSYCSYLTATLKARRHAEDRLDAMYAGLLYASWPQRRVAHLIENDLIDLEAVPTGVLNTLVRASVSPGRVLGALYVLEGSALGARLVMSRVAAIGMSATHGARHLAKQISDPMAWSTYLQLLEATSLSPDEEDACLEEARATFDCFIYCYNAAS